MRNLLLFGPILWLREMLIWLLTALLFVAFALYILGNSPLAMRKVLEIYGPKYHITYDKIEGDVLEGFEIFNLRYKQKLVAEEVSLKWDPDTLEKEEITIDNLLLKDLNVDVVRAIVSELSAESNSTAESTEPFGWILDFENIDITTLPFELEGVAFDRVALKSKHILYQDAMLDVEKLSLDVESNLSHLSLAGGYKNQVVTLDNLKLLDTNVTALMALFSPKESNETQSNETQSEEGSGEKSLLIPKRVDAQDVEITILPYTFDPFEIESAKLKADNFYYSLEDNNASVGYLELNASSNLTQLHYVGSLAEDHLVGDIDLVPHEALYNEYGLPFQKDALSNVSAKIDASYERVTAEIHTKGKKILKGSDGGFNVDIDALDSNLTYDINQSALRIVSNARVTTPYAKSIKVENRLTYDKSLHYDGKISLAKLLGVDQKIAKYVENSTVQYKGDKKGIDTSFGNKLFKGTFETEDFKKAKVHLETKEGVELSNFATLPKALKGSKATVVVDAPLDLGDFSRVDAKLKIASNLVNIESTVAYGKNPTLKGVVTIPKDSLLYDYDQKIAWKSLSPLSVDAKLVNKRLKLGVDSALVKANMRYDMGSSVAKGELKIADLPIRIDGKIGKKLSIKTEIKSVKKSLKRLGKLYDLGELPPLDGAANASVSIDKDQKLTFDIKAPSLTYQADRKSKYIIDKVELKGTLDGNKVLLKSYRFGFDKQKYFSSKVAKIVLGERIVISNFWINNELKIEGYYIPTTREGKFSAKAKSYHLKNKMLDIKTRVDIKASLDGDDTRIEGKISLLEGLITPQIEGRSFATDSDIIFVNHRKKQKKSPFMEHLSLLVNLKNLKPIEVRQKGLRAKFNLDLGVHKEQYAKMVFLGSGHILKGSRYVFRDKRFVFTKSAVYFTGDIAKPQLDIKAKYRAINQLITIAVTGIPAEPNINFSSSPSLTREQILSVLLFDSEGKGDTHSGNEMMRMMGGAVAKSALSDLGIKVDHLAFGEGNSVEVGKKLGAKTTVIYINGEVPKVKLKYRHGKHTESVIGVSKESQSYDIVYKRDF